VIRGERLGNGEYRISVMQEIRGERLGNGEYRISVMQGNGD